MDVAANPPPSGRAGPAAAGGHGDAPLPTWMLPVYSLPGYTARHPGISFPRDAVMLTIDDGPHPVWTPKILRLLQRHHVTATFCVIGRQAVEYPQLVDAVASEGHCLANHSFTHPRLPSLPAGAMYRQVLDTQDAITRAAATTPTLFRAPCGQWSPALLRLLAGHRLTPIDWDVDARDWARPGTARVITALDAAAPGDILLCHDGGGDRSQTYQALQTVLPRLTARGLRFVTLPAPRQ